MPMFVFTTPSASMASADPTGVVDQACASPTQLCRADGTRRRRRTENEMAGTPVPIEPADPRELAGRGFAGVYGPGVGAQASVGLALAFLR